MLSGIIVGMTEDAPTEAVVDDTGCTRCDAPLVFLGRKDLHEGGFFLLPALFEGRTNVEMWVGVFRLRPRRVLHAAVAGAAREDDR